MTIPTLIRKYQEHVTVVALKKTYSTFSQAYSLAITNEGSPSSWGGIELGSGEGATNVINILNKYLQVTTNCGNNVGCYPDIIYKQLNGNNQKNFYSYTHVAKTVLANGTLFLIYVISDDCTDERGDSQMLKRVCGNLEIDINGIKPPNTFGKDVFKFYMTEFGLIPAGTKLESEDKNSLAETCSNLTKNGAACAAWVLYKGNMDYLTKTVSW